jgi:hypothetical protein
VVNGTKVKTVAGEARAGCLHTTGDSELTHSQLVTVSRLNPPPPPQSQRPNCTEQDLREFSYSHYLKKLYSEPYGVNIITIKKRAQLLKTFTFIDSHSNFWKPPPPGQVDNTWLDH